MMGAGYTGGNQTKLPVIEIKEEFAWRPVLTTSGKWVWWRKYIKRMKIYWSPGEGPIVHSDCYTENEWLIEQIKNPTLDTTPKKVVTVGKQKIYY